MWYESKMKYYNYAVFTLGYIALFAFIGVFNFAFAQWDPSILRTVQYWASTLISTFTYVAAFQLTVSLASDIASSNHPEYIRIETEIAKYGRTNIHSDFSDFVDGINWISKRDTWKAHISRKLIKLNKRITQKMFNELRGDPKDYSNKTQRYICTRDQYKLWLTDEWINENLKHRAIQYPQITPSEIITGSEKPPSATRLIDNNVAAYAFKRRLGFVIVMIMITSVYEALTFTGSPFDMMVLATLAFKLFMTTVNIFSGWIAGIDAFKKKRLNSAYVRQDLLVVYSNWRKTKSFTTQATQDAA